MRVTKVKIPGAPYPVYLGNRILSKLPQAHSDARLTGRAAIVCDNNVATLHLQKLTTILRRHGVDSIVMRIPAGERQKSMGNANQLYEFLAKNGFRRNEFIIAFGGGVPGDLAGFVA